MTSVFLFAPQSVPESARRRLIRFLHFSMTYLVCWSQVSFWSNMTPRNFTSLTNFICLFPIFISISFSWSLFLVNIIAVVFVSEILNPHRLHQSRNLSKYSWTTWALYFKSFPDLQILQSSAKIDSLTFSCVSGRSFSQRRYNIRTGSAAYFWLIEFLVIFLCIVAPPVGTRCQRVRFVFFYRTSYVGSRSRHCYKIRRERLHYAVFVILTYKTSYNFIETNYFAD